MIFQANVESRMHTLKNKRFIFTRPKGHSGEVMDLLERHEDKSFELPMIEIRPNPIQKEELAIIRGEVEYDLIIFSSANAADFFLGHYKGMISRHAKILSIGKRTSQKISEFGYKPHFAATIPSQAGLIQAIENELPNNSVAVWPTSDIAPTSMQKELQKKIKIRRLDIYKVDKPLVFDDNIINMICHEEYDLIYFYSPSAVKNFFMEFEPLVNMSKIKAASIGEATKAKMMGLGIRPLFLFNTPDPEGMIRSTVAYYEK